MKVDFRLLIIFALLFSTVCDACVHVRGDKYTVDNQGCVE